MEQVEIGGLRIAYRRAGTGPPLVLVHGAVCDGRVWRGLLEDLADEFTVIAWDAPGCGGSDDPPETFRLGDFADCLAGVISALGLARPYVLGHSFGGGLALELHRRHRSLPGALVLAGAYAGWAGSLPPEKVAQRVRVAERTADEVTRGEFDPGSIPGLFSEALPDDARSELMTIMSDIRPAACRVMAYAFAEAALHAAIPGSQLAVLPGLGHEAYLEDPDAFTTEVRRFLHTVG
jgi:pimeloyl-ACP methyl ester carboxylesterase